MRTRFAPSPTGPLHLGHAFSALTAQTLAVNQEGECLLRIEDIDISRSRPKWETQIFDDLSWLGFRWDGPITRQSENLQAYHNALQFLWDQGLIYPCYCNRRDILSALSAPQEGANIGPDGIIYPGTCRDFPLPSKIPTGVSLRLNMAKAIIQIGEAEFVENLYQNDKSRVVKINLSGLPETVGDVVLARKDMGTSYHLSVVLDDASQGITHVVRGEDLYEATYIHVVLQKLLGLPTPQYHHHRLIRDDHGKRLAKRDDARSLMSFREAGLTPQDVRIKIGL